MPSVLEAYKADFGGTDEAVLEFVFRYLEEEYDQDNILSQVKVKNILITFEFFQVKSSLINDFEFYSKFSSKTRKS